MQLRDKAIPFFSLFSVVRPTQILGFSKKKSYTEGNEGNDTLFQTIFSLFSFDFNNDVDFFLPPLPQCWLCSHTLLFPGSTDIMLRYRAS